MVHRVLAGPLSRVPLRPSGSALTPAHRDVVSTQEEIMRKPIVTHVLGLGWLADFGRDEDGNDTLTVRHPEQGQRIDLPHESLQTLRNICRGVHHVTPTLFPSHFPSAH